jgi:hypothetical protein
VTTEQVWLAAVGALATAVALAALLLAARALRRATRAEAYAATLATRVAVLESPVAEAPRPVGEVDASTYVITHLDEPGSGGSGEREAVVAQHIDGRLFADIVARETVVKAASWTHGLRRALSAESRTRIRFQVRQETRQAGRERKAELKQALREYRARERDAAFGAEVGEDVA